MRVLVGDTRIHFEVDGARLVPDGPTMRELPTMICCTAGRASTTTRYDLISHRWRMSRS